MFTYRSCAVLTLSLLVAQGIVPSVSASSFSEKEKISYYSAVETETVKIKRKEIPSDDTAKAVIVKTKREKLTPYNDVETETVKIRRKRRQKNADLSFFIQAPQTAESGDKIEYILFAANGGPSKAQDVKINLSYDSALLEPIFVQPLGGSGCRIVEASTIVCSFGNMKAKTKISMPLMFLVKANAQCREAIYTKGYIKADKPVDLNLKNNVSYAKTLVECEQQPSSKADLSLKVINDASTTLGGRLKYMIDLSNDGPDTSSNTKVILSNPSKFLRFNAELSDRRCQEIVFESFAYNSEEDIKDKEVEFLSSSAILCNFGDIEPSTGAIASIVFKVSPRAECGSAIKHIFEADSDTNDPNSSNNNVYTKAIIECLTF